MRTEIDLKVREAQFFLDQMKINLVNDPDRRYYLSAFLSAAKSIDYYLIVCYKEVAGFKEWRLQKLRELDTDTQLKELIDLRHQSVHDRNVVTETEMAQRISNTVHLVRASEEIPLIIQESCREPAAADANQAASPVLVKWRFGEDLNYEVIPFCEKHLEVLNAVVEEAVERFE